MTTTSYNVYQQITSVRVATTANITSNYYNGALNNGVGATLTALSVGALSIDGILLEVGDRVLIKNQTLTSQNGLYVVQSAGSLSGLWMLERAPDFQSVEQLKVGQYFTVGAGATFKGSMFVLVEPLPDTIGMGTFTFVDVSDTGSPSGPFLLKAANLSDMLNREAGFTNLGLGSGAFLIIDESDFVAGLYTLTNPCPNLILVNATTPGNAVRLPPVDQPESFIPSQGPVFFIDEGFQGIDVQDSTGSVISPLAAPACEQFILTSNAFPQGVWFVRSFASTVNGKSGDVVLTSSLQTIYVSNYGNDGLMADGSILNPYATLSHALASITPSSSTPYQIVMTTGIYSETNVVFKPWVDIKGEQSQLNISGSISLHASWNLGGYLYFGGFFNLSLPAAVILDFNAAGSPFAFVNISNNIISSVTNLNVIGETANGAITIINNNFGFSGQINYDITNCYGAIQGGASGDINIINTSETSGGNYTIVGMTEIGNMTATTSSNSGMTIFHEASKVIGNTLYQSTGTGTLIALEKGVTHLGSLTLDNGSGGGLVNLSAATLTALPVLLNGATYNPDSISDAMNANVNFTPLNYTPVSGGPGSYAADSVTGNLAGIDAALTGSVGNVIKQQLWVNFADGLDTNSGGINDPFKTYNAARTLAALTASPTNRFLIKIIGDQTAASPLISPYIDLDFSAGTFTVTGGWTASTDFDGIDNEVVSISNCKLSGFFSFEFSGEGNWVVFKSPDFSLCTSGVITSSAGNVNGLAIYNDTSPVPTGFSSFLFINQSASFINGLKIAGEIRYDLLENGLDIDHYLSNSQFAGGGVVLKKSVPNDSTQTLYVSNTPMPDLVMQDDLSNVVTDLNSMIVAPTFLDDESYENITIRGVNGTLQLIYIDQSVGNDNNNGSINAPMKTYEAARLEAIARGAIDVKEYTIVVVGNHDITGDMMLSPNISISGFGSNYVSGFLVSGDVVIDPDWGTGAGSYTLVENVYIYIGGGDYNLTFLASAFSWLKFVSCAFNDGSTFTISGAGDNVTFENCTADIIGYSSAFVAEDVNLTLINMELANSNITATATNVNCNLIINSARAYTGNITLNATGANSLRTFITGSNTSGSQLTINGDANITYCDASSYMFDLVLSGGATLGNMTAPSKTDGMVNASYVPLNYVAAADAALFSSVSLTGNLKGIDNALGGKENVFTYVETVSVSQVAQVNTQYTANNAAVVSLTLPTTSAIGDKIIVNGKGAGGWRIDQQNAGHVIKFGALTTTVGAGGSFASATQYASVTITCITANDVWVVQGSAGTFTLV